MSEQEEEVVKEVIARKPTEKELFYLSFGPEIIKKQLDVATEILKQQMSICIGLLSVSLIFEDIMKDSEVLKAISLLAFFVATVVAFVGMMPFERRNIWLNSPSDIERYVTDSIAFKKGCYKIAGVLILLGLGLIVWQVII
ncbi:MAG TPA: hypothetical protein VK175_06415 [Leadbetterella sp.]|nr:hypothetical protein [Leadbetterella sp.]